MFDVKRAENRSVASALDKVGAAARDAGNSGLARKLGHRLAGVAPSVNVLDDFRRWSGDRLMRHCAATGMWCELILGDRMPLAAVGGRRGNCLLFPMEKAFERFAGHRLRRHLPQSARIRLRARCEWLRRAATRNLFHLRPDLLVGCDGVTFIVDAEWRLLDVDAADRNCGIAQGDLYRRFAYGKRYLGGRAR